MSTSKKTGLPKDWSKKIFDNRVVNNQHHRNKNVIPGTAELNRRDNNPISDKKVGHGRWNNGSYIGGFLGPQKYVNKKTGKADPEMGRRKEFEKNELDMYWLMENNWPNWPEAQRKKKKPVSGHWKPGH